MYLIYNLTENKTIQNNSGGEIHPSAELTEYKPYNFYILKIKQLWSTQNCVSFSSPSYSLYMLLSAPFLSKSKVESTLVSYPLNKDVISVIHDKDNKNSFTFSYTFD